MAVKGPETRVVGVEGHHYTPTRRDQHGVAHRAGETLTVDLDDLEFMAVQMHRMRHPCLVHHNKLDTLPLARGNGGTLGFHATLLIDQTYPAISPVRFSV